MYSQSSGMPLMFLLFWPLKIGTSLAWSIKAYFPPGCQSWSLLVTSPCKKTWKSVVINPMTSTCYSVAINGYETCNVLKIGSIFDEQQKLSEMVHPYLPNILQSESWGSHNRRHLPFLHLWNQCIKDKITQSSLLLLGLRNIQLCDLLHH